MSQQKLAKRISNVLRGPMLPKKIFQMVRLFVCLFIRNTVRIFTFLPSYLADMRTHISRECHVFIQDENYHNKT
jgi:hypothetical protein